MRSRLGEPLALVLPLLFATALIYALSAGFVPQLDDVTRPLTPDNHAYIALCRGHFAGIEEPFRFRILAPFLAGLAGDCTRGFLVLDFLCSSGGAIAIAFTTARITPIYAFRLLAGLLYLALFCPRAHEAPWLTDAFASAGSAAAFALTTRRGHGPVLRGLTGGLAAISGLGRELLPPLFLRMRMLISALRSRHWPELSSYGPALLGVAVYILATRVIGPQIGALSTYVTDVLSDTAAKDDPERYWAAMLGSMYFLWPYGFAWMLVRQPASEARRDLRAQAGLVIGLSLLQSMMGGDIGRLFRLFALPVFAVAAIDVAANLAGRPAQILLGVCLALSALMSSYGLMVMPLDPFQMVSGALLALNATAVGFAVWQSRQTRTSSRP